MKYENYDIYFPDQPVVDLYLPIWANLPSFRHKPAFIWVEDGPARPSEPSALTYHQLNTSVHSISSKLLMHSLNRGDKVAVLCGSGLELVEMIFACQRAGLVSVPTMPPHPSFSNEGQHHHLVRVLSQTKPKAALASSSYIAHVKNYISSSPLDDRLATLLRTLKWVPTEELKGGKVEDERSHAIAPEYTGCRADDVYLVQYTSGATGIPKPVLVRAGSAAHNVRAARKAYDLHPNSMIVSWLPQYHDCGLMFLLLTVVSGASCVLTSPGAFIARPRLWLEMISDYNATCTPVPSFTLPLVLRRGGAEKRSSGIYLSTLKNLILINEPIYRASIEEFVRAFGLDPSCISPSYGLAENCTFVSTSWRSGSNGDFPAHNGLLPSAKLPSNDRSIDEEEIEILVVNEGTHEPVEDGIEGEIWISSPSNAEGYLGHPSLTREVFCARLKNHNAGCYIRTGDRGVVTGRERYLYVTGRCSDVVKLSNGGEIHPHYIETSAYNSCKRMIRPGCIASFEAFGTIAVMCELQRGGEGDEMLRRVCKGIEENVMREVRIEVGLVVLVKSGSVPKTTSGKVQRWAAKDKLERGLMDVVMRMSFAREDGCDAKEVFGTRMRRCVQENGMKHENNIINNNNNNNTGNSNSNLYLQSSL